MTVAPSAANEGDTRVRRMLDVLERERADWAAQLHDRVLQGLAAVKIGLAPILRASDDPAVATAVGAALEDVRAEIHSLRSLVAELHPAELDVLGLDAALRALAGRTSEAGPLQVRSVIRLPDAVGDALDAGLALTIFRLVQEALANVVRHAEASTATVTVTASEERVHVVVKDDGRGFTPENTEPGFGLLTMRERVAVTAGTLRIESGATGTTVAIDLPRSTPDGSRRSTGSRSGRCADARGGPTANDGSTGHEGRRKVTQTEQARHMRT